MTIRINQTAVDFTLETETTVADLATSLQAWALDQNQTVLALLVDGKAVHQDDKTPLGAVSEIDVETIQVRDTGKARLEVIEDYFALLVQGLSRGDQALIDELQGEYFAVRRALFPLLDAFSARLEEHLQRLDALWKDASILAAAEAVLEAVREFSREVADPVKAVYLTLERLETSLDSLGDLGLFFQKGRDRDGFGLILSLFTLLDDLNRCASRVFRMGNGDQTSWAAFQTELQPILQEAERALSAGDYILLTDLIEYELVPRLRSTRSVTESLVLDPATDIP